MVQDFAIELEPFGVCALSLSPSKVKTEFILDMVAAGKMTLDPAVAQSVRLSGRAIAALASDGSLAEKNGQILTVSEVQREYGLIDPG